VLLEPLLFGQSGHWQPDLQPPLTLSSSSAVKQRIVADVICATLSP
jgi:hypothetical protein